MERTITLKTLNPIASTDFKHIRLQCIDVESNVTNVDLPAESFPAIVKDLIAFGIQAQSESVLSHSPETDNRGQEIPGTPALLIATDLDVVLYETGACLLRVTTSAGARLEIALMPKLGEFLHRTLTTALPGGPPTH